MPDSQIPEGNAPAPVAPGAPEAAAPAAPAFVVTDSLIQDLNANPEKLRTLPKEQRAAVLRALSEEPVTPANDPAPAPAPDPAPAPAPEKDPIATQEGEAPPVEEPPPEERKYKSWKDAKLAIKEQRERADAEKARAAQLEARLKEIEAAPPKPVEDPLDDTGLRDLHDKVDKLAKRNAELEKYIQEGLSERTKASEKLLQEQEETAVFADLSSLQEEFPELKTQRNIRDLNREFAGFVDGLMALAGRKPASPEEYSQLAEMVQARYESDPNFKAQAAARGVKPPAELDKVKRVLEVHQRKVSMGYPTAADAYLGHLRETGELKRRTREAAIQAASQTVAKVNQGAEAARTVPPSVGTSVREDMDPAAIEARVMEIARKRYKTPEDLKFLKEVAYDSDLVGA